MARTINKLSTRKVGTLNSPGLYGDGLGLWLKVTRSGTKSWIFRYTRNKKTSDIGLGSVTTITLAEARMSAQAYRKLLLEGKDPLSHKREQEIAQRRANNNLMTFAECAIRYVESHKAGWKNAKHAQQWENTLKTYVFPVMGDLPVRDIDTALVMRVLEPIWLEKNETAGRVRGRIENILSWAAVQGYRTTDNPAQWRGHLDNLLAKPSKIKRVKHHKAMPFTEIYDFMRLLRSHQSRAISAKALEFLILTVCRTSEVIGAKWSEIDLDKKIWSIPAHRMKAEREHRVPLSSRATEILIELDKVKMSDFVFPGKTRSGCLSSGAMDMLLQDRLGQDCTVHGFRSTFRDWAAECTQYPRDLCEMALAHTIKNKAEAAYRRGDMIEKRRNLAEDWLKFIETSSNVYTE